MQISPEIQTLNQKQTVAGNSSVEGSSSAQGGGQAPRLLQGAQSLGTQLTRQALSEKAAPLARKRSAPPEAAFSPPSKFAATELNNAGVIAGILASAGAAIQAQQLAGATITPGAKQFHSTVAAIKTPLAANTDGLQTAASVPEKRSLMTQLSMVSETQAAQRARAEPSSTLDAPLSIDRSLSAEFSNLGLASGELNETEVRARLGNHFNEAFAYLNSKPELFRLALATAPEVAQRLHLIDHHTLRQYPGVRQSLFDNLIALGLSTEAAALTLDCANEAARKAAFNSFIIDDPSAKSKNVVTARIGMSVKSKQSGSAARKIVIDLVAVSGWVTKKSPAPFIKVTSENTPDLRFKLPLAGGSTVEATPLFLKSEETQGELPTFEQEEVIDRIMQRLDADSQPAYALMSRDVRPGDSALAFLEQAAKPSGTQDRLDLPTPMMPSMRIRNQRKNDTEQQIGGLLLNLKHAAAENHRELEIDSIDMISRLPVCNSCGLYLALLTTLEGMKNIKINVLQLDAKEPDKSK